MNSLRTKLTVLLVAAIMVVVAGSTFFFLYVLGPRPERTGPHHEIAQIKLLLDLIKDPAATGNDLAGIRSAPPDGWFDPEASRQLTRAMEASGTPETVTVYRHEFGEGASAVVRLADGRFLVLPIGMMPPPPNGLPLVLFGWLFLIAIGTTGVVIVAVHRMTQPLEIIERAVAEIGPDGELPKLEETGTTEVRAAAIAINRLSLRLRSAIEGRMRIVAAAAHDLRTPLTRMRLRAEFLEDEREQWLADLSELDRIADSAIRLVREEVEGAGDEAVALDRLVKDLTLELQQTGLKVDLLRCDPVTVPGRPIALKRAVRNLMVNAATHGRAARIGVSAEADKGVLVIEDDGPGIPDALMARVFEPFFRVDPARQAVIPGAGLGLAIAYEIVTRHGGRLSLANRPGGGLLQRMELPRMIEAEDAAVMENGTAGAARNGRSSRI
ncbi:ATP-binding protein [Azorhizobium doebereinerae]|uniref:ATP-binding protein n=1 Tax=Azorhizobium doebereinerae TaxID=281091 RepID=UPI000A0042AC|nr:ATP-binding protein [Azorhizobium doebereinerae]